MFAVDKYMVLLSNRYFMAILYIMQKQMKFVIELPTQMTLFCLPDSWSICDNHDLLSHSFWTTAKWKR